MTQTTHAPAPPEAPPASRKPCHDILPVKAHPGRRIVGGLIDGAIALAIGGVVTGVLYAVVGETSFASRVGALAAGLVLLVRDGVPLLEAEYRSLGKHLMRLRPVSSEGTCVGLAESAARNLTLSLAPLSWALLGFMSLGVAVSAVIAISVTLLVALEVAFVVLHPQGRRIGDHLAGTTVHPVVHQAIARVITKVDG
jgi:uncharacterized RDD family membrane protein YckC